MVVDAPGDGKEKSAADTQAAVIRRALRHLAVHCPCISPIEESNPDRRGGAG
jgi:hypothetical protein